MGPQTILLSFFNLHNWIFILYILCASNIFKETKCFKEINYMGRYYECRDKNNELFGNYRQTASAHNSSGKAHTWS